MSDIFEQLASPFDPSEVDWRMGSTTKDKKRSMALAYIDARTVMDRLDVVCGPAGWQNRYVMEGTKTVCEIGILCGDTWVWKADGAGDSDIEAEKGALSDAFKRAAVRWGIGRYLYTLDSPWVDIAEGKFGRLEFTEEAKQVLNNLLRKQMKPALGAKDNPPPKPDPYEYNIMKAKQWVKNAKEELSHTIDAREVDNWYAVNTATIVKLQKNYGDQFKEIMQAIVDQRAAVQVKDAAE